MSKLADLEAAAMAKLGNAHADVLTYITALKSSVRTNRVLLIVAAIAGAVVGALIGHAL